MHVLTIDTSSAWVSAGVVELGHHGVIKAVYERTAHNGKAHGELLAGHVEAVLRDAGLTPADLDALVVGVGPGPFTGLRVGIVSAATLAALLDRPLYGVPSLDAIAAEIPDRPLLVATDARRREVYWARYGTDGHQQGPDVGPVADLDVTGTVVGDGAVQYGLPGANPGRPLPRGLVVCAVPRLVAGAPGETPEPMYLRRPDAVVPTARKSTVQR